MHAPCELMQCVFTFPFWYNMKRDRKTHQKVEAERSLTLPWMSLPSGRWSGGQSGSCALGRKTQGAVMLTVTVTLPVLHPEKCRLGARFAQVFSIYLTWVLKSVRTWTPSCSFVYRYLTVRLGRGFCDSIRIFTFVSNYLIHIFKMTVGTWYLGLAKVSFADEAMQLQLD